ncbi:MAG TPA: hypothetical protein PKD51_11480 [Saprospiraceae bacterium]|nr:hypothetical protein [Saprospiraceae bacterium]
MKTLSETSVSSRYGFVDLGNALRSLVKKGKKRNNKQALMQMHQKQVAKRRTRRFLLGKS